MRICHSLVTSKQIPTTANVSASSYAFTGSTSSMEERPPLLLFKENIEMCRRMKMLGLIARIFKMNVNRMDVWFGIYITKFDDCYRENFQNQTHRTTLRVSFPNRRSMNFNKTVPMMPICEKLIRKDGALVK